MLLWTPTRCFNYLLQSALGALLCLWMALAQAQEAAPVSVAEAKTAPIMEDIPLTGTVTSAQVATLSTAVGGLVQTLYVDVGDRVEPDSPLLELDPELAQIALEAARANLASARADLAEAQRRVDEAQPLVQQNSIAATEMHTRESGLLVARAQARRAEAQTREAEARLARHRINAPYAGVISRKYTEAGEWVSPGNDIFELVSTDRLRLDFQVPQRYYPRINQQASIFVRFDTAPDRPHEAEILSTVPVSDPQDRTFLLRAELLDDNLPITSGMSTHGVLQLRSGETGVSVPRDALLRYADGRIVVWVVDESGDLPRVIERVVTIGLSAGGRVEIRSGLSTGERVVTRGNEALQPGQAIQIVAPAVDTDN